ncbi:hypothetical protein AX769_10285 [Frondihabitans sp. PAMC 28766]|uniref:hypothetical protein n=1 Tax=Frondihabitans sp. PAMC 28766 TaxID=1795630 RepID=UPI00078CFD47|nr:hypothetical protein [Frondihabitans sp. PAMC 28766]AMM20463.1 hypothetical protein AX769_10285 [Frondihabitans sp. PAMC 28766]
MEPGARKAELEQAAFGAGATAAERTAALRQWAEAAEPPRADGDPGLEHEVPAAQEPEAEVEGGAGLAADAESPPLRPRSRSSHPRRRLIATIAAATAGTLVVGIAIGALLSPHTAATASSRATTEPVTNLDTTQPGWAVADGGSDSDSTHFDGSGSPTVLSPVDGSLRGKVSVNVAAAEKLLSRARTAQDAVPAVLGEETLVVASSTRRVATGRGAAAVWVARQVGKPAGFCLIAASSDPNSATGDASTECSASLQFGKTGMTLQSDTYSVTWAGGTVTVAFSS